MAFDQSPSRNLSELALLITDHINAMLAYWDKDLVCRYANSAYVDWFGPASPVQRTGMLPEGLLIFYRSSQPY